MKPRKLSQNEKILAFLEDGYPLTALEALELFGCFRLASRIHDIRKMGHAVFERTIEKNGKHYSQYFMAVMLEAA